MDEPSKTPISTESYKGVRDFYPEDLFVQNYIFSVWKSSAERFGYAEYNASVLEPAELYRAKSGDEIVNEQTYTFTDRGDREVTLRPEMTPTVARLVAQRKRDLSYPIRWFSIPNLFRYERPQKGRLREHWQLNVDLFGVKTLDAEAETIALADDIMRSFGAESADFEIVVSSRKILNDVYAAFGFDEDTAYKVSKLIDKKAKISADEFSAGLKELVGERAAEFEELLIPGSDSLIVNASAGRGDVAEVMGLLEEQGITNVRFDITLMRGFDYYTGVIFEIYDRDPENNRSLFGGGRYDDLLSIFGTEKVPAVGFGMGDVTIRNFLESRGLMPAYAPPAHVYVCPTDESTRSDAAEVATLLRANGVNAAVDLTDRKLGDQIKKADKEGIPFVIVVGEDEIESDMYTVKELASRSETKLPKEEIASFILGRSGR